MDVMLKHWHIQFNILNRATLLAAQTMKGSASVVLETGDHPALLKDAVTTPAGCTIDGILELEEGKLRPALLLGKLPGDFDDWLICMISSQIRHYIPQFDELIQETDSDFALSSLKSASVIRVGRLAVVQGRVLLGATGYISPERLQRIKNHLAEWISRF